MRHGQIGRFIGVGAVLTACAAAIAQPNAGPDAVRYDGYKVVRVMVNGPGDRAAMEEISGDALNCRAPAVGPADYLVAPDSMAKVEASGVEFRVMVENLQTLIDRETADVIVSRFEGGGAGGTWFTAYKDYANIGAYADLLVGTFSSMASRVSVGTTLQGREIFAIRIAAPGAPVDRPAIIVHGLQHAREWITGMSAMYLADRLLRCSEDPQVASVLSSVQFIIVPVLNPDGYNHTWANNRMWRKNRRPNPNGSFGIDLNRNWGMGWGGEGSSPVQGSDLYRGPAAFSEMETQALRDFITARPYIKAHFDVHSYGQLILSPWGHTQTPPPDAALFNDLNAVMHAAFASVHGTEYEAGQTYDTIYPASGTSNDWTYGDRGIYGWGFELRDTGASGFLLPAGQIIANAEEVFAGVMSVAEALAHPLRFTFPDGVPSVVQADAETTVRVVISPMSSRLEAGTAVMLLQVGTDPGVQSVALTQVTPTEYAAVLPAIPCGSQVQFAFGARALSGAVELSPAGGMSAAYVALAGQGEPLEPCAGCAGDFNGDGLVFPDDLSEFITCFFLQVQFPGFCSRADFNGDGVVFPDDLSEFITAFFLGC